ncbi:hypothetical protein [Azotobacter chroococcum]|uniref:hypothetical protein n=1 Tax=Azotobacter chroococcum TaxID=353 RepID=UPI001F604DC2|nr:hypothetical protein [Azotobacter chroococcum]
MQSFVAIDYNRGKAMDTPIALPEGWSAEVDQTFGVVITGVGPTGHIGYVTISESLRSFELGTSIVRKRQHYSGRYWRKELYQDSVASLRAALS